MAGLDRTYVSLIECGKRNPSLATLTKIGDVLGVRPWEILKYVSEDDCGVPFLANLKDSLAAFLNAFETGISDTDVAIEIIQFCANYGFSVGANRQCGLLPSQAPSKRRFLVGFESDREAIRFSVMSGIPTFGFSGVVLEVV